MMIMSYLLHQKRTLSVLCHVHKATMISKYTSSAYRLRTMAIAAVSVLCDQCGQYQETSLIAGVRALWGMCPWWPSLKLVSSSPIIKSSHCNSAQSGACTLYLRAMDSKIREDICYRATWPILVMPLYPSATRRHKMNCMYVLKPYVEKSSVVVVLSAKLYRHKKINWTFSRTYATKARLCSLKLPMTVCSILSLYDSAKLNIIRNELCHVIVMELNGFPFRYSFGKKNYTVYTMTTGYFVPWRHMAGRTLSIIDRKEVMFSLVRSSLYWAMLASANLITLATAFWGATGVRTYWSLFVKGIPFFHQLFS